MFANDPTSWHNGYKGNNEIINQEPIVKFNGSAPPDLIEQWANELRQRIQETNSLINRAETQGEKDFYKVEIDTMSTKLYLLTQQLSKVPVQ